MQQVDYLPISAKSFVPPLPGLQHCTIIFATVPMTGQLPVLSGLLVRVDGCVNHYGRIMHDGLILHIGAVHSE